jgi:hypothetical protein
MSHRSTPLRFLVAILCIAGVSPAIAQDATAEITLKLPPAQVAEIARLVDLQPISKSPPPAYWDLQIKIQKALETNPDAMRAVLSARSAAR